MNFLALVQELARQSGTLAGGTTLASVSGATGRADKVVNWIVRAWDDIQNQRADWLWMNGTFEKSLIANTLRYTANGWSITRLRKWSIDTPGWQPLTIYDPTIGQSDESPLTFIPWSLWRTKYDRGSHDAGRPVEYSVSPANELCFGPKPDKAYTARGEYWKSAQTLSANGDEPEAPEHLHMVIVWRAMMLMAGGDESTSTYELAKPEYLRLFGILCAEQLPAMSASPGALA